jgi:hypothetical protein
VGDCGSRRIRGRWAIFAAERDFGVKHASEGSSALALLISMLILPSQIFCDWDCGCYTYAIFGTTE